MTFQPMLRFTASYTMESGPDGYRFRFHCAQCDESHTTGCFCADSVEEAYAQAAVEARSSFNGCHRCGQWVCDEHYNEDEMMCTQCAPR